MISIRTSSFGASSGASKSSSTTSSSSIYSVKNVIRKLEWIEQRMKCKPSAASNSTSSASSSNISKKTKKNNKITAILLIMRKAFAHLCAEPRIHPRQLLYPKERSFCHKNNQKNVINYLISLKPFSSS